jgi:type IV pilus assembly protein PilA
MADGVVTDRLAKEAAMPRRIRLARRIGADEGFTLVELLVVMLIVGLLAAIAVPSFIGQRGKAHDAAAKTSVRTAATAIETYRTDNDGAYTGATAAELDAIESTLGGADLSIASASDDAYEIAVASETGNAFTIERHPDGTSDFTCTDPSSYGCPSNGIWAGG